jgi:hypothetical protein
VDHPTHDLATLLELLWAHGVAVWVERGVIHHVDPTGTLPAHLREALASNGARMVAQLNEHRQLRVPRPAPRPGDSTPSISTVQRLYLDFIHAKLRKLPVRLAAVKMALPQVFHWRGVIDKAAMNDALATLISRSDSLRSVFAATSDGGYVLSIREAHPHVLQLLDLSDAAPGEREERTRQAVRDVAASAFDLATDLKLRALLVSRQTDDHVLALVFHHIVFDATSLGAFMRRLMAYYAARVAGGLPPPEGVLQGTDFAHWEQAWHSDESFALRTRYWRSKLTGARQLALPYDLPGSAVPLANQQNVVLELPSTAVKRLRTAAAGASATTFMFLLTALGLALSRWSCQWDFSVTLISGARYDVEFLDTIGMLVAYVPLRIRASPDTPFRVLLQAVRQTVVEATQYSVPHPVGDAPVIDLESAAVNYFKDMGTRTKLGHALEKVQSIERFAYGHDVNEWFWRNLEITITERASCIEIDFAYSADRLSTRKMRELTDSFHHILTAAL